MQRTFKQLRSWLAAVLAIALIITGLLPAGVGFAAGGLTLDGFPLNVGDPGTQGNPYIHYEPQITLSGTYASGIEGDNLRLRITTNNGNTVEDLSSVKPVVDKTSFSFSFNDIDLKPGLNKISFYENTGDLTRDLLSFYVQYNNTPVLSDLKFNSTMLTSDPTVIQISSARNLLLDMSGKAVNANSVKVVNKTTGQSFTDDVSSTGSFRIDFDAQLGLNELDIHAYNQNKEVMLIKRSIVVTVTGGTQGSADQFYDVDLLDATAPAPAAPVKLLDLVPNTTPDLVKPSGASVFKIDGFALINIPPNITPFVQKANPSNATDTVTVDGRANTLILRNLSSVTADVYATPTYTEIATLSGNYKQYQVTASFPSTTLIDGDTYELEHTYKYVTTSTASGITTTADNTASIASYKYKFKYTSSTSPRFGKIINLSEASKEIIAGTTINTIRVAPVDLEVEAFNMANNYQLFYNDSLTPLTSGTDYSVVATDLTKPKFTLYSIPPGETKVMLKYNGSPSRSISFIIKQEVTPFVQLKYDDAAGTHFIDTGLQFTDTAQVPDIDGSLFNYLISSGMTITLNEDGDGVDETNEIITPTVLTNKAFKITKASILAKLKPGNNILKVELNGVPKAAFTYSLLYISERAPKIENLKLQVEQNGKSVELAKKSTDAAYSTTSFFLSTFSFDVKDATDVTIYKNGKIIAEYKLDGSGDWQPKSPASQGYLNNKNDATQGDTTLERIFKDNNFPDSTETSNTLKAEMTSREYGDDLLDRLVDLGLNAEDLESRLALFPLTLSKGGNTSYEIEASDGSVVTRQKVTIAQQTNSWEVISPTKPQNAKYITVNTNNVPIKIFAEKANKVTFGKIEAVARNTDKPDFKYDQDLGKSVPETYYVFEATVPLKPGLNVVKFTVEVGTQKYNDQIEIYNVNSSVDGAESRDVLGKKIVFSVFDKGLNLKFPAGTVLLTPSNNREGNEVRNPQDEIFTDVPLYFGIADRTTGRVSIDDSSIRNDMEDVLQLDSRFNYASPLYFIDAGYADSNEKVPGGRDPYFEGEDSVTGEDVKPFVERWEDSLTPSKQATITIMYDPSIVNAANNILTIFYNNGDEWTNLGGVVNTGSKTVTVPFKGFGYYMVMKTRESFSDVIRHEFARDAIETLYSKGIMNDGPGAGFGTELKINRGEFATMIVKALDLPINAGPYRDNNQNDPSEPTFRDVRPSDDDWDYEYKYIETAARAGIIRGKDTRAFYPDDSLTREEASIIIARALNMKLSGTPEAAQANLQKLFTDGKDVGYYAATSVLAVTKAKIMNGEPNDPTAKKPTYRFNPTGELTRAEMAVITVRIMVQLKKLPKQ